MKPLYWSRYLIIALICSLIIIGTLVQIVRIQSTESSEQILAMGSAYLGVNETIIPDRGKIFDREGNLLAGNETTYEIGLDLYQIEDPETIATVLSSLLDLDYFETLAYANIKPGEDNRYFIVLTDFVSSEKVAQLERLKEDYETREVKKNQIRPSLSGVVWSSHTKRSYPEGKLASNVIGFYGFKDRSEGRGYFGVEEAYNSLLSGTPTEVYYSYDPQLVEAAPEVPNGADLILTIDREIQAMTEIVLDEAVDWAGATAGTIIIYNPQNGEVLSMATTPRLDPNEYWNYSEVFPNPTPFNRAISKSYEPGSVFKVLTMAAALDAKAVTPETKFVDTGQIIVGGIPIFNWNRGAWGEQDMTGCMQHSLNVCLSWVATELGEESFYKYMQQFGLNSNTGIDLAGEINWPMRTPGNNQWFEVDLATNSFGQGIALTPIQMVMSVSALANNGRMMAPHVVKSMIIDGHQYEINPVIVGSPISADTAQTITQMLSISLEEESSIALVEGYRLAGKTGTAQIATEFGYSDTRTHTSFVGWGPSDNPQFLVYVWLEEPTISMWGSEVAAPVFADIVEKLVVLLDIPPDSIRLKLASE